jgi:hypothetical protein
MSKGLRPVAAMSTKYPQSNNITFIIAEKT